MKQLNMYQNQESAAGDKVVFIDDLDVMVDAITSWHKKEVATLEHMLTIPEGVEIIVGDDEPIILTGDLHAGFLAGITLSLISLGTLPFTTEPNATP